MSVCFVGFVFPKKFGKGDFMDLTGYALDTATVLNAGSIVVLALASIWAVRKVIAITNKS